MPTKEASIDLGEKYLCCLADRRRWIQILRRATVGTPMRAITQDDKIIAQDDKVIVQDDKVIASNRKQHTPTFFCHADEGGIY